ncbi:nucleoside hydrolase [Parendozoicomonas haliclonae]|uniref:Pyrimidine-specific ribonucleoside hydrolase RihB n=1 Tax=Parendozoicomonas haliclonae TaxID=1960125 RepID=A0A1X7AIL4_9GAMM|nr:nucleoside hydrolase [Parendozoicomonas haliclonae]SMA43921.1 Pyrimidine-specific ribonucleoside hydrolase RihB [Parendozoicomonas haliclonae]
MKEKLIIDTDPGIDDALAIYCALQDNNAEVLALTTIFGNANIDITTENTLRLLDVFERDIPVYRGAAKPLVLAPKPAPAFVHGENGFGDIPQPKATRKEESLSAAQYIVNMANQHPGEITLVPLGPLTNLALALQLDPTLATKIKKVVLMGGNLHVPGNISSVAEANIYSDPHAADMVFTAQWPVTVVGLDVTHHVISTPEYFDRLEARSPVVGKFLNDITRFYMEFYQQHLDIAGCHVHDSSAIACALYPEWFEMEQGQLRVLCDEEFRGKVLMHKEMDQFFKYDPWKGLPTQNVAVKVDHDKVLNWMESL